MRILKSIIHRFGRWYCNEICRREFLQQSFIRINERPIELSFVFRQLIQTCPQKVLDVGTGTTALPHLISNCGFLVTATDNVKDYWPSGMFNRHYYVMNDDITDTRVTGEYDFISCVSVLEHVEAYDKAIASMFKLLHPNGHLVLTFPYNESQYIPNAYKLPGAVLYKDDPSACQIFSRNQINRWLEHDRGRIVEQEYWQFWDGEFWRCGSQVLPPLQVDKNDRHQLTCLRIQKPSEQVGLQGSD